MRLNVLLLAVGIVDAIDPSSCISANDGRMLDLSNGRYMNDDFCDCKDGSDEWKTAACSHVLNANFECYNHGMISHNIHSSRVHDGVCDCCDGSDEFEGNCLNTCQEDIEQKRNRAIQELAIVKDGVIERQRRLDGMEIEINKKKNEVESHYADIRELNALKSKVQIFLDREARREYELQIESAKQKEANAQEKCLSTDKDRNTKNAAQQAPESTESEDTTSQETVEIHQSKVKRKLSHAVVYREHGNWMSLGSYMHDVVESVKRIPVRTPKERRDQDFLGPFFNGGHAGRVHIATIVLRGVGLILSPLRGCIEVIWWSEYHLSQFFYSILPSSIMNKWQNLMEMIEIDWRYNKSLFLRRVSQGRLYWWHSYISWIIEILWDAPVITYKYLFPPIDSSFVLPEAESLRNIIHDIGQEIEGAKKAIDVLNRVDSVDYGTCCRILKDVCVVAQFEKYMYKVCPFKDVHQDNILLGSWKSWIEKGKTMLYGEGDQCWNGPPRSTHLILECGAKDKIRSVEELSTCVYTITMATPAACSRDQLDAMEASVQKWMS